MDVFNLLNQSTPKRVVSTNRFSPAFGAPRRPIDRRRMMLGLKVVF